MSKERDEAKDQIQNQLEDYEGLKDSDLVLECGVGWLVFIICECGDR